MTVAEYEAGVAELERKLARIAELRAAIKAQRGEMAPEQIQAFAFNDLRSQPADVTGVTPGPETVQGAGLSRQKLGEEQLAAMTDPSLQPTMTGQPSHDVDEITNQVNRILARGQGGDVPAEATATRQIQTPEFEAAMAPVRPDIGPVEKPIMESVDEAVKAAGPAFVHSLTMGAITLSQRDQKAIENSPIAGAIASFAGDIAAIVGPMKGAKLTLAGFKRVAPSLIKEWFAGGEEVGKVLVNAAAREGLGGAYWSALRQTVEETVNPEEQRDWNDRLTQLATDVGMFAIGGAAFEGVGAGMGRGKRPTEVGPTEVKPTEVALAERATAKEVLETVSPVREAEAVRAEAVRRPAPKSTEEALGVRPTASGGAPKPQATAEQLQELADRFPTGKRAKELETRDAPVETKVRQEGIPDAAGETSGIEIAGEAKWEPKRFDYAAREVNGKPVFGQVTSEVDEAGMVTFKPRKGKAMQVKAEDLREPTSVPRQRDDIEQVLEAAENQRRVAEEMRQEGIPDAAMGKKSKSAEQVEAVIDEAAPVGGPEVGTKPIKPVGQKVREVADKFEAEAKARITKRHKDIGGTAFDIGGATKLAAEELADYAIIGAAKIAKGAVELADFTKAMIEEYGEKIKPFIEDIHKKAQEEFHALRAQAVVDQHIEYLKGISQPFEYRPKVLATPTASGGAPSFRTGYARLREIKQGLREKLTGEKLRGRALEEQYIDDELGAFTEEAWQAGAPVMRTKEGSLIPVFESKADAERIWEQVYGRAKARLDKVPRLGPDKETEITREARRLFLQEMVDRGVALRVKRSGVKLSPDVKRKTDLSLYIIVKAEIGAEKLKEALRGIDANDLVGRQAVLQRIAMERGLLSPAVRAQGTYVPLEFASYGGYRDVAGETLDPTRLIQQIDGALSAEAKAAMPGGAGPAERNLLWRTRDMLIQKMNFIGELEAMGKQIFAGIKSKGDRETISDILEAIAKDEGELSVRGALAKSEVRDITTNERLVQAALDLRKIYGRMLKMQNAARAQRSQRLIPERDFYSPRKHKEVAAWQELLGINADPANLLSTGSMIPDFVIPNKPSIGHDLQRLLLEPKYELEKDALVLLEKYANAAARDIFDTSIIQNAKAFMDQLEGMGFGKSAVSLRDWVGQSFAGAPHGIDKKIGEALSSAFGDTVGKNWQSWSGKFRGALARSVFPLNFSWNLFLQTSSGILTHVRYGTQASVKGAVRWFTDPAFREEVATNAYSYIVKTQQGGKISHQDINTGMARAVQLEKGPLETAADAANFLSEWIERHMTGWSVATGYEDGLKKGLSGKALWEYASDAGAKTQSMYNKEDLPGLLRSAGVKTVAPFQTFSFEMWNTVREVMGKTGTPPATAQERAKMVLRFVAGATAVNMAFGAASGRKPWEIGSALPFYPIWGAPVEAAVKGESLENASVRGLPSVVGIGVAFGKAVEDVIKDNDWTKVRQWMLRYGTSMAGIPGGTQFNRIVDGLIADAQGGVVDKNGKIIFPISDTKEQIKAVFGGPWSTEAGQEKITSSERGVIEIAPAKSTGGKVAQTAVEALPIVGDVVEFRRRKEDEGGIDIVPGASRRSNRRRVRRR